MADIMSAATQIFNPFVPVIALVMGVSLAIGMIMRMARIF
jgi:hypothetical protein